MDVDIDSFNPYFTGSNSGSSRKFTVSGRIFAVSILILLEVILEDPNVVNIPIEEYSFNPYFTGSNSGS